MFSSLPPLPNPLAPLFSRLDAANPHHDVRLMPHGGIVLFPIVLASLAFAASLADDGCDYARVTGRAAQLLTGHAAVPYVDVGPTGLRVPGFYPAENVWRVALYDAARLGAHGGEGFAGSCSPLPREDMLKDFTWLASGVLRSAASVIGGTTALFLWAGMCLALRPRHWRSAGVGAAVACLCQAGSLVWFASELCATRAATFDEWEQMRLGRAIELGAIEEGTATSCAFFFGARCAIASSALYAATAAVLLLAAYPVPEPKLVVPGETRKEVKKANRGPTSQPDRRRSRRGGRLGTKLRDSYSSHTTTLASSFNSLAPMSFTGSLTPSQSTGFVTTGASAAEARAAAGSIISAGQTASQSQSWSLPRVASMRPSGEGVRVAVNGQGASVVSGMTRDPPLPEWGVSIVSSGVRRPAPGRRASYAESQAQSLAQSQRSLADGHGRSQRPQGRNASVADGHGRGRRSPGRNAGAADGRAPARRAQGSASITASYTHSQRLPDQRANFTSDAGHRRPPRGLASYHDSFVTRDGDRQVRHANFTSGSRGQQPPPVKSFTSGGSGSSRPPGRVASKGSMSSGSLRPSGDGDARPKRRVSFSNEGETPKGLRRASVTSEVSDISLL